MSNSTNNHHSNEAPIRLRSYQIEMLQESLRRNVIVAMDTGSGKTYVAVARIRSELENMASGKLVWFMTPGRALSDQQYKVLRENLPAYHIRSLTGADNVDKWTDQRLWDTFLEGVHVVVGTPAVLLDALTHGFIKIMRLALCVFDEVHRCTKNHPMNKIMKDFYHPAKVHGGDVPHILGLSASPVFGGKISNLAVIESDLDAVTVTPKAHRTVLAQHVHRPDVIQVPFPGEVLQLPSPQDAPAYVALTREVQQYDILNDPYVLELQEHDDTRAQRSLEKVLISRKTYCRDQLNAVMSRSSVLYEQLGPTMAEWYTYTCLHRFLTSHADDLVLLQDLSDKEQQHLTQILSRVIDQIPHTDVRERLGKFPDIQHQIGTMAGGSSPQSWTIHGEMKMSGKALQLKRALLAHADVSGFCGIVFVQHRATVTALAHMLRSIPEVTRLLNIGTFVGTSVNSNRKASIADLVDLRTHSQDLDDFRSGTKNLMIATDVLEEGIDIPACNAVFCFDLPSNLVSFVQRRGRARQARSQYFLCIAENDLETDPAKWQRLEDKMVEAYRDDTRDAASAPDLEDEEQLARLQYLVPSTGALLTMDNAKAHLHHFCSVSTRSVSRYTDPRPEFEPQKIQSYGGSAVSWKARVTLPSFIHTSMRIAESSLEWRTEDAAIKDAAFVAYTNLHKAGLVTNNLLPPRRELQPDVGKEHANQPSLAMVSERRNSWQSMAQHLSSDNGVLFANEVTLHLDGRHFITHFLWLPVALTDSIGFNLYWNADATYQAEVRPLVGTTSTLKAARHAAMFEMTHTILRSVFNSHVLSESESNDLVFLVTPHGDDGDLQTWLKKCQGTSPAAQYVTADPNGSQLGLVHVAGQVDKRYMFREISDSRTKVHGGNSELPEISLTAFPKRRDFLHPPVEDAHKAKQSFPVPQCTVENLPVQHAIFAAFLPCILHEIDIALLVDDLRSGETLAAVGIQYQGLIREAISAPSAGPGDYNRLEYLGDTILKFCTELQVIAQHPIAPESYLSAEKDRIVRNDNLAKVALEAGLDRYILTKSFTGNKWRPPNVRELLSKVGEETREMSSKVLADVVEALIGAAYVDGGLDKAYACIRALMPAETWWDIDPIFDRLHAEVDQSQVANLELLENLVGHRFSNKTLLVEAITHASYQQVNTGMSYERLEFFGDAVLDLIVTPKLYAHRRKLRHWDLHRTHEALVNGHFLGFCCMTYSSSETLYDVVNTGSVRWPQMELREGRREYQLHDFIRASTELFKARFASVARFQSLRTQVTHSLSTSELYPWSDLIAMHPDKFLSDIVEAILGALYIDTRGDLDVCEAFADKIGILPTLRSILDSGMETAFPKEMLGILADREAVKYDSKVAQGQASKVKTWECEVTVGIQMVAKVEGCGSKEEAEVRAAERAAKKLTEAIGQQGDGKRRKLDVRSRSVVIDEDAIDDAAVDVADQRQGVHDAS